MFSPFFQESLKFQQVMEEREEEIQSRFRQTDPLREKLSAIEKLIAKIAKSKDHFHAKLKDYQVAVL
jgi:uncharacterized coiled-coil DUF342 family protein